MLRIKKLTIKNFRSIENISIDCSSITAFVGLNDAGKSNVLRALNLFFNGETDHALKFDFDRDYNIFSIPKVNKAKEIVVELLIELPETYKRNEFPSDVIWRQVWRASGLHYDGCFYKYSDKQNFPPRSRIPLLLERMVYNYIPAIKDNNFFSDLKGQVYDVLQSVAESNLRKSAISFESEIQNHLKELLASVSDAFHSKNDMRLPDSLRQIFENLEFNQNGIPLSRRGDGIKVRHIPMILRFIAEKRNSISRQGFSYHFWGFEEPENNVEMSASFELANQFLEAAKNDYQIFLTTHSPVFYGLSESNSEDVIVHSVTKQENYSKLTELNRQVADHEMGLMQLVAPYVNHERELWMAKKTELEFAMEKLEKEKEVDKNLPHIFVEGATDKTILEKAISVFFPTLVASVKIDAGDSESYGSAEAAASRAIAWQCVQRHRRVGIKGWLLLDKDNAGEEAKNKFEKNTNDKVRHIKADYWDTKKPLGLDAGFKLPIDMEYLYPDTLWEKAEQEKWLEEVQDISQRIADKKRAEILKNAINGQQPDLFNEINESLKRRVKNSFSTEGKVKAVKWLNQLEKSLAQQYLVEFEPTVKKILKYFELIAD